MKRFRPRFSVATLLVVCAVVSVCIAGARRYYEAYHIPRTPIAWHDFRPGLVEELRSDGQPVLIHFTANWGPSSIAMLRAVFETPEIRREVHRRGHAPVLVDCTAWQGTERELLATFGANAIPLTAVYPAGASEPIVFRGMHTKRELVAALRSTAGSSASSRTRP